MNHTLNAIDVAVERALSVLHRAPAAFVTDIDGTISAIVPRPEDASVGETARDGLRRLSRRLALVAVVTAREEAVARRMVGVESLTYVGNYALDSGTVGSETSEAIHRLKVAVRPLLLQLPCVTLEEKGISFSLHYRNCLEEGVRERLLSCIRSVANGSGVKLLEGKQVIEAVPEDLPDKGVALARLLDAHGIDGCVFTGDDLSDIAAFREVRRRSGLTIAVVDIETPAAVREAADIELGGVAAVAAFLDKLAGTLEGEGNVSLG